MSYSVTVRKLAAILSADVVGYSRLMGADETGTHQRLMALRGEIADLITRHDGRVVGTAGDSVLADFPSVVEALGAAVDIQKTLGERNTALPADQRLDFRIGINLGDVIVDGDDIFGDGVNVAARLETLAEPGSICVSGAVYEQVKNKLDLGFRDRGSQHLKNIAEPIRVYDVEPDGATARAGGASQGSRLWVYAGGIGALALVGGVAVWLAPSLSPREDAETRRVVQQDRGSPTGEELAKPALGTKPTIAVLPFDNQSGDAGQDYFSDGVTQDVIGALGRFSNLVIMSWDAVLPYKGGESSLDQVSHDLDVRYVVRGTVRRAGDRVRVAVQLTDATRGVLLWSDGYDQRIDDIFAVQDEITQGVAGALAVKLTALEQKRALAKPTDNLDAYDYVLRGRQSLQELTRSANTEARKMFERAIELDPEYAIAYVGLGHAHGQAAERGWTEWPDAEIQEAYDLAQRAIRLDPSNAEAYELLAAAQTHRGRYDLALDAADRALELNPNDAENHGRRGWVLLISGHPAEAARSFETAIRYNPSSPVSRHANLGFAYFLERRYDDAIGTLEHGLGRHPDLLFGHAALAATYAEADRGEDAARSAGHVRRLYPFFEVDAFVEIFDDRSDRERIAAALREAGLE